MSNEIKKGDLVKAWLNDPSDFVIGRYSERDGTVGHYVGEDWWHNAVKIPKELAEQLEELGV